MTERKPTDRHQEKTPSFGDYPWANYSLTESGTLHAWSEQSGNPASAWFQGGTGAFRIHNADGSTASFYPGESRAEYEGMTVTVSENYDQHVGGHYTIKTKGGMEAQITGEGKITIAGATMINVLDNAGIQVKGNAVLTIGGTASIDAAALNLRSKGDLTIGAGGTVAIQGGGGTKIQQNGFKSGYTPADFTPAQKGSVLPSVGATSI